MIRRDNRFPRLLTTARRQQSVVADRLTPSLEQARHARKYLSLARLLVLLVL